MKLCKLQKIQLGEIFFDVSDVTKYAPGEYVVRAISNSDKVNTRVVPIEVTNIKDSLKEPKVTITSNVGDGPNGENGWYKNPDTGSEPLEITVTMEIDEDANSNAKTIHYSVMKDGVTVPRKRRCNL